MIWSVELHQDFLGEFSALPETVQDELLVRLGLLEKYGPALGRPHVDTLKGSRHPNMKELRFQAAGGVWRVAFAFDPSRSAIILVAGNKVGKVSRTFYGSLIKKADQRLDAHLTELEHSKGKPAAQ
jgi:hypothetical protein